GPYSGTASDRKDSFFPLFYGKGERTKTPFNTIKFHHPLFSAKGAQKYTILPLKGYHINRRKIPERKKFI
ncbi:MAG: hypothetical protein QW754_03340, partial [Thermoplasmata archaeon]